MGLSLKKSLLISSREFQLERKLSFCWKGQIGNIQVLAYVELFIFTYALGSASICKCLSLNLSTVLYKVLV